MPETTATQDQNVTNNQQANQGQGETPASWDDVLKGLPEPVRALYDAHVTGLKNTVDATRREREELSKQIKDLLPKAEKGSELEKTLTEATSRLEVAERRAAFFEDAGRPEIGCKNPRLAWTLAQAEQLFDRKGAPDWTAIKSAAPELFGAPQVNANAGTGTGNKIPQASMDDWIRRAAGRG